LGRQQPNAGLSFAEYCRTTEDCVNGWVGTRVLIFIPVLDWNRFKRAQRTGAHVVVKGLDFDATIRYTLTIADGLVTDRSLGPTLVGIHRFRGSAPDPDCGNCEWVGATVSYGSSQSDVEHLTRVRIALLNALLFRRRAQTASMIADICARSGFLKLILHGHTLLDSAVRMEISRLRDHLGDSLDSIGAPYAGKHFLPFVPHGTETYSLSGNRHLIHVPNYNMAGI